MESSLTGWVPSLLVLFGSISVFVGAPEFLKASLRVPQGFLGLKVSLRIPEGILKESLRNP